MTAFTEALKERTRERVPLDWASLDDPGSVLAVKGTLRALDCCGPIWREALSPAGP